MFPLRALLMTLPFAAAVGAGGGFLVAGQFLTKYVATIQMEPIISDTLRLETALFREVQPAVLSVENFRSFMKASGNKLDKSGADRLDERLSQGQTRAVGIEYNFGVAKSDLRDMPEAVAREYGAQLVKEGLGAGPLISSTDKRPEIAISMARLLGASFSDTALRVQLQALLRGWWTKSNVEITSTRVEILSAQAGLDSLQKRLEAMMALRDSPRVRNTAAESSGNDGTMVQVTGPRFLSVSQQFLAIESEKIDVEETIRQLSLQKERLEIKRRIGDVTRNVLQNPNATSMDMLNEMITAYRAESDKLRQQMGLSKENLQRVLSDVDLSIQKLQARYVEAPPERLSVRREGPTNTGAAVVGALAGIAALMVLFALWFRVQIMQTIRD